MSYKKKARLKNFWSEVKGGASTVVCFGNARTRHKASAGKHHLIFTRGKRGNKGYEARGHAQTQGTAVHDKNSGERSRARKDCMI